MSNTRAALLAEWLDRAWTLSWGSIVLATLLLLAGKLDSAQWLSVWTPAFGGFMALRLIDTAGQAWATARQPKV